MLNHQTRIFVKERVGFLKLTDVYDLLDPESQAPLGEVRDEPSPVAKWARLLVKKGMLPTTVNVYLQGSSSPALIIRKRPTFFRGHLEIMNGGGQPIAFMTSKFFSLGGAFTLTDAQGGPLADLKGDWKGWNFTATYPDGSPMGLITKKWAGLAKEMFTSADQYLVALEPQGKHRGEAFSILLGAALAIDLTYKEQQ